MRFKGSSKSRPSSKPRARPQDSVRQPQNNHGTSGRVPSTKRHPLEVVEPLLENASSTTVHLKMRVMTSTTTDDARLRVPRTVATRPIEGAL